VLRLGGVYRPKNSSRTTNRMMRRRLGFGTCGFSTCLQASYLEIWLAYCMSERLMYLLSSVLYRWSPQDTELFRRSQPVSIIGVSQDTFCRPSSQPTNQNAKDVVLRLNVSFTGQPFLRYTIHRLAVKRKPYNCVGGCDDVGRFHVLADGLNVVIHAKDLCCK